MGKKGAVRMAQIRFGGQGSLRNKRTLYSATLPVIVLLQTWGRKANWAAEPEHRPSIATALRKGQKGIVRFIDPPEVLNIMGGGGTSSHSLPYC